MDIRSITFNGFKCFEERTELDLGAKVTLLIGKNNVGKTTVLDVVRYFYGKDLPKNRAHPGHLCMAVTLDEECVSSGFRKDVFPGFSVSNDERDSYYGKYGQSLVGQPFIIDLHRSSTDVKGDYVSNQLTILRHFQKYGNRDARPWRTITDRVLQNKPNYHVFKIAAERDIIPEKRSEALRVEEDGSGVTSVIDSLLNDVGENSFLIESELRDGMNRIFQGEITFDRILTQQTNLTTKHIYFLINDNRIALSEMGSGVKTVLFVVFALLYFNNQYGKEAMFLFEEIENNLHPEVQRRLFDFVYQFAETHDVKVFLSSHSNVAINYFYGREDCSIVHIYKDGDASKIKTVQSSNAERELIDDLGVRASDMMQTNGVIWVEGPSDRIYIKKWLELADPSLLENEHYSFLYYGGKLLSHFEADSSELSERISILKTNQHSALVMDSDIQEEGKEINETKKRVRKELEESKCFVWITSGKEIENYLAKKDLAEALNNFEAREQIGKYELFPDYIKDADEDFLSHKVDFARDVAAKMNVESLEILDLKDRIQRLAQTIREWNGMETFDANKSLP